jgi:hypothetical protein
MRCRFQASCRPSIIAFFGLAFAVSGCSSSSSPSSAPDAAPPSGYRGEATFLEYASSVPGGAPSYQFLAAFFHGGPWSDPCAGNAKVGGCCFIPPITPSSGGGAPSTPPSAGTLSITDGTVNLGVLAPTVSTGTYADIESKTAPSLKWNPGDTLNFSAGGATGGIAPFSGSVVAVALLESVTPDPNKSRTFGGADFTITWKPDASPDETIYATFNDPTTPNGPRIHCDVPDSAGTLTVPGDMLGRFPSGDSAFLQFGRYKQFVPKIDDVSMQISSQTSIEFDAKY